MKAPARGLRAAGPCSDVCLKGEGICRTREKLSILSRRSGIDLDRKLKDLGLTRGQLVYLMCICDHEGIVSGTALRGAVDQQGRGGARGPQVRKGRLYTRVLSKKDRRQYGLYPTERQSRLTKRSRAVEADWEARMTRNLSAEREKMLDMLLE